MSILIMLTGIAASVLTIVALAQVNKAIIALGMLPYFAAFALKIATDEICKAIRESKSK